MSSTFKNLKKKASQYIRHEKPSSQRSAEEDSLVSADCLARFSLVRNKSRKIRAKPQFKVRSDSPPPQLPEMGQLFEKKVLKRSKSTTVLPIPANASQGVTTTVVDMFNLVPLRSIQSSTIRIPGGFPSSSSASEQTSSRYSALNQSTKTVIRVAPMCHDRSSSFAELNRSSDNVIRHVRESLPSAPRLADDSTIVLPFVGSESKWATTSESDGGRGIPTPNPRSHSEKGKGNAYPGGYYPRREVQRGYGLVPSAFTADSVRDLPPHKHLRRQSNVLSQHRSASVPRSSDSVPKAQPEQIARRRSSHCHLPSTTSKGKLLWGNLSSDFASENSEDLRQLRKDLRLPSRQVSTPNLSYLRLQDELAEGFSEQPGQSGPCDPFFDASNTQQEVFSEQEQNHEEEAQANDAFFQPPAGFFPADTAIIANLRSAVQRVEMEMARLRLENHQILYDIEEANNRAAFWEERSGGIEEEFRRKQRELEELWERAVEAGIQTPERHEAGGKEMQVDHISGEDVEDIGYHADVSRGTTMESYIEDMITLQPGDAIVDDEGDFS